MKKILSIVGLFFAGCLLASATGTLPINATQSGTVNFVGAGVFTNTVTFPVGFTIPPYIVFSATTTNATPLTNTITTTTNFTLEVAATNVSVNYTAYLPYPRVLVGTNTVTAGTLYTNIFSTPFAATPILNVEGTSTNVAGIVAVQSVTTSQVVFQSSITQLVYWGAFGLSPAPGTIGPITY